MAIDRIKLLVSIAVGANGPSRCQVLPDLQLRAAGESAARACARWRDAATAWDVIITETRGLTGPGVSDLGDLIVRLGRLAFTDPQWTPARVRHSPLRDPAEVAPGPAQFTEVVSAVHHAVSAVMSIAATDLRAVDIAVRVSRLHVPTRTLPDGYDVPRNSPTRFRPLPPHCWTPTRRPPLLIWRSLTWTGSR
jgi:hypothetical protein